jgi:hypothetical protein
MSRKRLSAWRADIAQRAKLDRRRAPQPVPVPRMGEAGKNYSKRQSDGVVAAFSAFPKQKEISS